MDFNSIITSPWMGVAGTAFGVLSIVLAVFFYLRTRRFQRPTVLASSNNWFDAKSIPHDEIKLTFRGKTIPRFTITQLYFWNSGNQTIKKSDFAPTSELRLKVPKDTEIFDIRITCTTAPEIQATLVSDSSLMANTIEAIPISFDYLDANDGFVIQVIHDHDSANADKFQFLGKLPGVSKFERVSTASVSLHSESKLEKWILPMLLLSLGCIGVWSLYLSIFNTFEWVQVFGWLFILYIPLLFSLLVQIKIPAALKTKSGATETNHLKILWDSKAHK